MDSIYQVIVRAVDTVLKQIQAGQQAVSLLTIIVILQDNLAVILL